MYSPDANVRLMMYQWLRSQVMNDQCQHSMTWGNLTMMLEAHGKTDEGEQLYRMKTVEA